MLGLRPMPVPDPAADYDEAMAKAAALAQRDGVFVSPVCRSRVIDQGRRTHEAVVLMHGFTSCPQQWSVVADAMAAQGRSVVVPRLPKHGYRNRLTGAPSRVHPEDLLAAGHGAVDIAAGLGDRVTVAGLSGGGTLAAWLAGHREDVAEAVLVAPLIVPKVVPDMLARPLTHFPDYGKDVYLWWDMALQDKLATPPYAYPRYSVRALAAFLAVGAQAGTTSRRTQLRRLAVVTNDNDGAVDNDAVADVAAALTRIAQERRDLVFPLERGYDHDVIDPAGECAEHIRAIYAELGPLLGLPDLAGYLEGPSPSRG